MKAVYNDNKLVGYCAKRKLGGYYYFPYSNPKDYIVVDKTDTIMVKMCEDARPLSKTDKKYLRDNGFSFKEIREEYWSPTSVNSYNNDWKDDYSYWYGYNIKRNKFAFETRDGIKFFGASEQTVEPDKVDVVICLTTTYTPKKIIAKGYGIFSDLHIEEIVDNPNTIHLPVEDYQAPVYSLSHYKAIMDKIKLNNFTTPNNLTSVVVYCGGGLGRTGTVLGAFAILEAPIIDEYGNKVSFEDYKDVITYIRGNYDPHAIESKKQEEYLKKLFEEKNNNP